MQRTDDVLMVAAAFEQQSLPVTAGVRQQVDAVRPVHQHLAVVGPRQRHGVADLRHHHAAADVVRAAVEQEQDFALEPGGIEVRRNRQRRCARQQRGVEIGSARDRVRGVHGMTSAVGSGELLKSIIPAACCHQRAIRCVPATSATGCAESRYSHPRRTAHFSNSTPTNTTRGSAQASTSACADKVCVPKIRCSHGT